MGIVNLERTGPLWVLYIEDVPTQAEVVETFLELSEGDFIMDSARTFAEAVPKIESGKFDIILLDLGLPDGEGPELVQKVYEMLTGVPIVVLTGSDDPGLGVACLQAGAQDFLNKKDLTPQKLTESLTYSKTRMTETLPSLERVLARLRVLRGSGAEVKSRLQDRYRELLTNPKLLFTVEHWTLAQALAREGLSSEEALSLHSECLQGVCRELPANEQARYLQNSELVALATMAFMADTYREATKK